MNELLYIIGIFLLGILATIGSIWIVQLIAVRLSIDSKKEGDSLVSAEEFLVESLSNFPAELSKKHIKALKRLLRKRYRLSKSESDEKLTSVLRSHAFERVTGARCTCYADSKEYGKYFHAPSCEYRKFLE